MTSTDLLLIGGGHAHLVAMRCWIRRRTRPPGDITLITPTTACYYSGRLPAYLAGRAAASACTADIAALCRALNIRLITDEVNAFDPDRRQVSTAAHNTWQARVISFNTGAAVRQIPAEAGAEVITVKPFLPCITAIARWQQQPETVAIIGAGAAGAELALALARTLPEITLISRGEVLATAPKRLRRALRRYLQQNGITLLEHVRVECLRADGAYGCSDTETASHRIRSGRRFLLTTGAQAFHWYRRSGICTDSAGFPRVDSNLQSLSHTRIFAAGDCAACPGAAKSGVYAVRQGSILAENLPRALCGQPLLPYRPQKQALALIADGNGGAFLSWQGLTAHGRWCGWLKDCLDSRYLRSMLISPENCRR